MDDMRWVWAAYKKDSLGELSEFFDEDADPDTFNRQFASLLENDLFVWSMQADTPRGRVPVGMVIGRPFVYGTLIMGNFTWFPWASKRNVYESTVNIINSLRDEAPLVFHVEQKDKEFANWVARHGIMRRVGTMHEITDEPLAVFQSRRSKWAV